jgi:hypothetical protein
MFASCVPLICWGGSGYSEEGNRLSTELRKHLIQSDLCANNENCKEIAPIYRRDGRAIELNLYSATDPKVVQAIFGFVAANGLRITNGKPVILNSFPKAKKDYVNSISGLFANRKPVVSLRLESQ